MIKADGYRGELEQYVSQWQELFWPFNGKSLFISGSAGLIGSYLIDLFVVASERYGLKIKIGACDRDVKRLNLRFAEFDHVVERFPIDICAGRLPEGHFDYVIHAASNTSPVDYATKPIDTIWTNVFGAKRLLEFSVNCKAKRFLFCSSVEAYGRNNGDTDCFAEDYSGYVDCNTVRANYPTSKRCVEALCNAYAAENPEFEFVTARIGRFYGPTVIIGDAKAPSQFIGNALRGEDIVMKSDGTQLYSWGYVGDCATALLTILLKGHPCEAYNVADPMSCAQLRDFAKYAAEAAQVKVVFTKQSEIERSGYSKITKATLNVDKLCSLGWSAKYHLPDGIERTVRYLRQLQEGT